MGGRPSQITQEPQEPARRICAAFSAGATRKDAALIGGLSYETLRLWMHKGEGEISASIESALDPDAAFDTVPAREASALYMAVLQAGALFSIRLGTALLDAALSDPKYAIAWLERRLRWD